MIVSGDEKQMPPTTFFASKVENDEAAIFDGEEPEEEATEEERDVRGNVESAGDQGLSRSAPTCALGPSEPDPAGPLSVEVSGVHILFECVVLREPTSACQFVIPTNTIRRLTPIEVLRSDGITRTRPILRRLPTSWSILAIFGKILRRRRSAS